MLSSIISSKLASSGAVFGSGGFPRGLGVQIGCVCVWAFAVVAVYVLLALCGGFLVLGRIWRRCFSFSEAIGEFFFLM